MAHGTAVPMGSGPVSLGQRRGLVYGAAVCSLWGGALLPCARSHVEADPSPPRAQVAALVGRVCLFRDGTVTCVTPTLETSVLLDVESVPFPQFEEADMACGTTGGVLRCDFAPSGWQSLASPGADYVLRQNDGIPLFLAPDRVAVLSNWADAATARIATIPGLTDAISSTFVVVALARGRLGIVDLERGGVWEPVADFPPTSRLTRLSTLSTLTAPLVWTPGATRMHWYRDGLRRPAQVLEAPTAPVFVMGNSGGSAFCLIDELGAVVCANDGRLRCEDAVERPFEAVALPGPASSLSVGQGYACAIVGSDVLCWGRVDPPWGCSPRPVPVRFATGGP